MMHLSSCVQLLYIESSHLIFSRHLQAVNDINSTWPSNNDTPPVVFTRPDSSTVAEYGYLVVSVLFLFLAVVTCCYSPVEKLIRYCTHPREPPIDTSTPTIENQISESQRNPLEVDTDASNPPSIKNEPLVVEVHIFI
jgi:hypothetical protein